MGSFEWACPRCGQTQKTRAPNGTEVEPTLCAACKEAEGRELEEAQLREAQAARHKAQHR